MSLLAKFAAVEEARRGLGEIDPTRTVIERLESPTLGIINGARTILAGTNNYLGMTFDAEAVEAGREALTQGGHRHHGVADGQRHLCRPCGA